MSGSRNKVKEERKRCVKKGQISVSSSCVKHKGWTGEKKRERKMYKEQKVNEKMDCS